MKTTALDGHEYLLGSAPKRLDASLALAKLASKRRAEPLAGDPSRLNLPLMLSLNRATAETLTARAIEESRRLEDLIRETLERYAGA